MESTRQQKIARLIQQDMSEIFQRETKSILGNSMITVTRVRISPDLSIARILVSIFPIGGDTKEDVMNKIQENIPDLRRRLGMRVGKQLRIIPNLFFLGRFYVIDLQCHKKIFFITDSSFHFLLTSQNNI
jgi:ribosome-binding factor A